VLRCFLASKFPPIINVFTIPASGNHSVLQFADVLVKALIRRAADRLTFVR
jgi:hypothetical protein